jgi:VWFA-related protein
MWTGLRYDGAAARPLAHFSARSNLEGFMTIRRYVCALCTLLGSSSMPIAAQIAQANAAAVSQSIRLEVVVETKSGQPVTDLEQKDFTLFDDKAPRPITRFRTMNGAHERVNVIVMLDSVNSRYQTVAYARDGVDRFLKAKEGQLANPTSIAVLTDQGIQLDDNFSTNGLALSDALEHRQIGLREITRDSEWGGQERLQICIRAMHQLIDYAGKLTGRTVVLWISPGWPLISGPRVFLDAKQEAQIFNEIVALSTNLRQLNITIYNLNPLGVGESLQQADLYEAYTKGVSKVSQVQLGDLAVQVLAVQSGGLAIEGNSDVEGMLQRCLRDTASWYEIEFDPTPADQQNEYHSIDIKVDKPGLMARTRDGYYANPVAIGPK